MVGLGSFPTRAWLRGFGTICLSREQVEQVCCAGVHPDRMSETTLTSQRPCLNANAQMIRILEQSLAQQEASQEPIVLDTAPSALTSRRLPSCDDRPLVSSRQHTVREKGAAHGCPGTARLSGDVNSMSDRLSLAPSPTLNRPSASGPTGHTTAATAYTTRYREATAGGLLRTSKRPRRSPARRGCVPSSTSPRSSPSSVSSTRSSFWATASTRSASARRPGPSGCARTLWSSAHCTSTPPASWR